MFSAFCGMYFYTGFSGLDGCEIAFLLDLLLRPDEAKRFSMDLA